MSPLASSMVTSACTLAPYFLARAAMMPSCSSPYSSARSSCLVFDTSRNAAKISAELTIHASSSGPASTRRPPFMVPRDSRVPHLFGIDSLLHAERQPRFLHLARAARDRRSPDSSSSSTDLRPFGPFDRQDPRFEPPAVHRTEHVRPPSHEPAPTRAAVRSGRSPGDDTCNTYRSDTSPPASSRASMARDARAQSSTVTFRPSRRSIRTSTRGRDFVPPRRSSTRSNPKRVKLLNDNVFQLLAHVS